MGKVTQVTAYGIQRNSRVENACSPRPVGAVANRTGADSSSISRYIEILGTGLDKSGFGVSH